MAADANRRIAYPSLRSAQSALRDAKYTMYHSGDLPPRAAAGAKPSQDQRLYLSAIQAVRAAHYFGQRAAVYQLYPGCDEYGFILRAA